MIDDPLAEYLADELAFANAVDARVQRDLVDEVWAAVRAVDAAPYYRTEVGEPPEPRCELRELHPEDYRRAAAALAERVGPRPFDVPEHAAAPLPPQLCSHRPAADGPVRVRLASDADVRDVRVPSQPFLMSVPNGARWEAVPDLMSLVREQARRALWGAP